MKTPSSRRDIGIIGAGAIGSILGQYINDYLGILPSYFGHAGPRSHQSTLLRATATSTLHFPLASKEDLKSLKLVLCAVKAHQVMAAIRANAPFIPSGAAVVVLCNGMVDVEVGLLVEEFPEFLWRRGVVSFAAKKLGPESWQLTNEKGTMTFGPWNDSQDAPTMIEAEFCQRFRGCRWVQNISRAVREKWLFNTSLNTLLGILDLAVNGDALQHTGELTVLFQEAFALGEDLWGPWERQQDELFRDLLLLIQNSAENQNSLVRDLKAGLPTESQYLAGQCLRSKRSFPALEAAHYKLLMKAHLL